MNISFVILAVNYEDFRKKKEVHAYAVGKANGITVIADLDEIRVIQNDDNAYLFRVRRLG